MSIYFIIGGIALIVIEALIIALLANGRKAIRKELDAALQEKKQLIENLAAIKQFQEATGQAQKWKEVNDAKKPDDALADILSRNNGRVQNGSGADK